MKKALLPLIAILVIALSSCSVGPDFQKPQIDTLQTYRFDSLKVDSIANVDWWNLFNDELIDTLVVTALVQNMDLNIAIARIEEARAVLTFTGADRYPKLDVQAGAARGNFTSGLMLQETGSNFSVSVPVSWELDFWGKFRRATEAARADLLASEYSLRTVQLGLISEVIATYFQLLDYQQRLNISKETMRSRTDALGIIQQKYDQGVIPELDLNQAVIQMEIAVASIPVYERLIARTENSLAILLGKNPEAIEKVNKLSFYQTPPEIPPGIPSNILERRPDILQAEFLLKAQNARVGVAAAQQYPSISLTGVLGIASGDLSTITSNGLGWSAAGSLFGPLFNFGKNAARVEVEEARTKQILFNYEKTVLNAFREVENSLVDIDTYKREVESKERQVVAAKKSEILSRLRYDKGVASYLEVLYAEQILFSSQLSLSETKQMYFSSYVKLYKALGGGWISKEEKEEAEVQSEQAQQESQN